MIKKTFVTLASMSVVVACGVYIFFYEHRITCKELPPMNINIASIQDLVGLFARTPQEINARATCAMEKAKKQLAELVSRDNATRTFDNTVAAYDRIAGISEFSVTLSAIETLEYVHPDASMREAAHAESLRMREFVVDQISNNRDLYRAVNYYAQEIMPTESLRDDQRYFVHELIKDFKRAGLDLDDARLESVKSLQREIAHLTAQFDTNIAQDNRTISVTRQELQGLDDDFINSLKRDDAGNYILGIDYPTYFNVRENCSVATTRKKLFIASNNRGYPANDALLCQVIQKRAALAQLLGFASYAHLDLDAEMAQNPERVEEFLTRIWNISSAKASQEHAAFKKDIPASVELTQAGAWHPWDLEYVKNQYKKQYLNVDERAIAEYFPMEQTIKGLLAIYEQFLSIRFEMVPVTGLWHEDVQLVATYDKQNNQLLGYLLLDLYPRANKYSHACHITLVPAVKYEDSTLWPEASLVIANFPKSTPGKPSLLKRDDVKTFFHEFGHAMHGLLGRTYLACQSGTSVKRDFVEMPSQMLEEWLWDDQILTMVSSHYITGKPLPTDIIQNIKKLKHFDSGDWTQRQIYLSFLALRMFDHDAAKNPQALQKELYARLRPQVQYYDEDHMYASFGHLTGYAARYYGYMWSKVFALDMFEYIKQRGLLDAAVGQEYITKVIGKGGSKDPNELLKDFLGREPQEKAFLENLG